MKMRLTAAQQRAILAGLVGVGKLLDGVKVKLFVNDVNPSRDSVLADFTEATFAGYAAQTAVFNSAALSDAEGDLLISAPDLQFTPTGPSAEVVFGYYLTDTAGAVLIGAYRLPQSHPILSVESGLLIDPMVRYGA